MNSCLKTPMEVLISVPQVCQSTETSNDLQQRHLVDKLEKRRSTIE